MPGWTSATVASPSGPGWVRSANSSGPASRTSAPAPAASARTGRWWVQSSTTTAVLAVTTAALISQIHAALVRVSSGRPEATPEPSKPAVSVKKSMTADYLVCLEDGKRFKSLKRHLRTQYSMTPEQYREKWGLPADYPMVAPNYAVARSALAKKMGLGQQRRRRK